MVRKSVWFKEGPVYECLVYPLNYRGDFVLTWPFLGKKVSGLRRVQFMSVRFIEEKLIRKTFWPNKIFKTVRLMEVSGL